MSGTGCLPGHGTSTTSSPTSASTGEDAAPSRIRGGPRGGDEAKMRRVEEQQVALEAKVVSLGNLGFLMPETNVRISNRSPMDYLREIASTEEGRASLEAQLIPRDEELWTNTFAKRERRRPTE